MAVKYKEYKPEEHTWSNEVNTAQKDAEYWNKQQLQNFTHDDFKDSQQTTDFLNQYNNMGQAPAWDKTNNTWWNKLTDTMNAIENRQPFSYDVNGDALYQQYKDQYVNQGKMAMMDTMGQAATMTGGYGNSYAQSVGQQAYQGYLQQLTDKIPELYQLAYDKYNREGDELYNRLSSYGSLYNTEYGEHRDAVSDHQYKQSHLADMWSKSHAVDMDNYSADFDKALAENESYNSIIDSNRTFYNDVLNALKQTEWGMHMDNETLKKLAIEVANDNLYREEQSRIADADLAETQRQFDTNLQYDATGSAKLSNGKTVTKTNTGNGGGGSAGTYTDTLWYDTGTTDDNGNKVFRNSDGKTMSFGKGVNPYTGTTNPDVDKGGTFSNGYQPNNIGGVKLSKATDENGSVISTNVTGKDQTIWKAGGKYYLWRGDLNRYVEVELPK